jgi:hypothetical protein
VYEERAILHIDGWFQMYFATTAVAISKTDTAAAASDDICK